VGPALVRHGNLIGPRIKSSRSSLHQPPGHPDRIGISMGEATYGSPVSYGSTRIRITLHKDVEGDEGALEASRKR